MNESIYKIKYLYYKKIGNVKLAEHMFNFTDSKKNSEQEFLNWLRSKCSGRMDYFDIAIKLCGKPITKHRRFLLAKIYAWHSVVYADKAIYYINLYLNNGLYKGAYKHINYGSDTISSRKNIHLSDMYMYLGQSHERLKEYDNAIRYYKEEIKYRPEVPTGYVHIANVYKNKKELQHAIDILEQAKNSKYYVITEVKDYFGNSYNPPLYNKSFVEVIDRYLNEYKDLKLGIKKHEFFGFDYVEGINNKYIQLRYKELKNEYKIIFDIHRQHLRKNDELSLRIENETNSTLFEEYTKNCLQDIDVYKSLKFFYFKLNNLGLNNHYKYQDSYSNGYLLPKKCCIFLEKHKRYNDALLICKKAIENGIIDDGTKGKMYKRLEKLEKLAKK